MQSMRERSLRPDIAAFRERFADAKVLDVRGKPFVVPEPERKTTQEEIRRRRQRDRKEANARKKAERAARERARCEVSKPDPEIDARADEMIAQTRAQQSLA